MDATIFRLDPQSLPQPHILPTGPRVALEITRGRVQQRVRPIVGKVFLIGAASDCDLVLGDLQFPEAFAYVFVCGSQVSIRRLGAGPQLVVCGEPVESAELFHGDLLMLGPFELRVLIDEGRRAGRHGSEDHDDKELPAAIHNDRTAAIDEVRSLLVDVRRWMSDESSPLRLYTESEDREQAA